MRQSLVQSLIISLVSTALLFVCVQLGFAQVRSSTNYQLQSDSINIGGGLASSTSYGEESTVGEIASGQSTSTNYQLRAGYQQMQEIYLSLSPGADIFMTPDIGGLTGGTSNGSTTLTVITDNPAGYSLAIEAQNSPAMQSGVNSIPNHMTITARLFNTAGGVGRFGYSAFGGDVTSTFKNNGTICGSGSNVVLQCWRGLQTTPFTLSQGVGSNHPDGATTTVYFRVGIPSGAGVESGEYIATTTITALPL